MFIFKCIFIALLNGWHSRFVNTIMISNMSNITLYYWDGCYVRGDRNFSAPYSLVGLPQNIPCIVVRNFIPVRTWLTPCHYLAGLILPPTISRTLFAPVLSLSLVHWQLWSTPSSWYAHLSETLSCMIFFKLKVSFSLKLHAFEFSLFLNVGLLASLSVTVLCSVNVHFYQMLFMQPNIF